LFRGWFRRFGELQRFRRIENLLTISGECSLARQKPLGVLVSADVDKAIIMHLACAGFTDAKVSRAEISGL
jgi:hypothetical protein